MADEVPAPDAVTDDRSEVQEEGLVRQPTQDQLLLTEAHQDTAHESLVPDVDGEQPDEPNSTAPQAEGGDATEESMVAEPEPESAPLLTPAEVEARLVTSDGDVIGVDLAGCAAVQVDLKDALQTVYEVLPVDRLKVLQLGGRTGEVVDFTSVDFSALAELVELGILDIQHATLNQVPDALAELRLAHLGLSSCAISDLTSLASVGPAALASLHIRDCVCGTQPDLSNFEALQTLIMTQCGLTTLSASVSELHSLQVLSLRGNAIECLPAEMCQLHRLEHLDLGENQLFNLPANFGNLFSLKTLLLDCNAMDFIPKQLYSLEKLTELDMSRNTLKTVSTDISNLSHLQKLKLSFNNIEELPREAFKFPSMLDYNVESNQLTMIPDYVGEMWQLTSLNVSNNKLTSLPDEVAMCVNLERLEAAGNQISTLPPELRSLRLLSILNLANNAIEEFPSVGCMLTELTHLRLDGNSLSELPPQFDKLNNLTTLMIDDNKFTHLPIAVCMCPGIQELTLSRNKFAGLPPQLTKLSQLTLLDCAHNSIKVFPNQVCRMPMLEEIRFNNNLIEYLPTEIEKLTNLRKIIISHNKLDFLPREVCLLPGIEEIWCSHQTTRDDQNFVLPPELESCRATLLDVSASKVKTIPPSIGSMENLEKLYIDENEIVVLPDTLCNLANLRVLHARRNQLTRLPANIGDLAELAANPEELALDVRENPLEEPPSQIVLDGQLPTISSYMKECARRENILMARMLEALVTSVTKQEVKVLQRKLKIPTDTIQQIEKDFPGKEKIQERARETLEAWKREYPTEATSRKLAWLAHVLDLAIVDTKLTRLNMDARFLHI